MTILQVLQLIAALAAAGKDVTDLVTSLRAQGHADNIPIPPEHLVTIINALHHVDLAASPLGDPDAGGGG